MAFSLANLARQWFGASDQEKTAEAQCQRLSETLASYKTELQGQAPYKMERDLFFSLTTIFGQAKDFDELLKKALESLARHLKARYYAIFWHNPEKKSLEFRHGKGYQAVSIPSIPVAGSLLGRCLTRNEVLLFPTLLSEPGHCDLKQHPAEYNALYAPIVLSGKAMGVVSISNFDPVIAPLAREALTMVSPLLSASLERILYFEESHRSRRSLDAVYSIARALEETLDEKAILEKACQELPKLLPSTAAFAVRRGELNDEIDTLAVFPEKALLGNNEVSHQTLLRNLFTVFTDGTVLIPDIHVDRRWAWPDSSVRSLAMVPIRMRKDSRTALMVLGPATETYSKGTLNLLGIAASQVGLTLERAAHFRVQENLARCDGLTGLLNHRVFQETLRKEIERTTRYGNALSFILLDVDHFKKFNDTYGHPVGDQILKRVAEHLTKARRATDHAFRYGGEEFCLLLPETGLADAAKFGERVRLIIAGDNHDGLQVTVSLGLATYRAGESPVSLVDRADKAMYQAKQDGRNRLCASGGG